MLKTGKAVTEGQSFHRRLISEYNTDITLDNYVAYFSLKPIVKKIEKIRIQLTEYARAQASPGGAVQPTKKVADDRGISPTTSVPPQLTLGRDASPLSRERSGFPLLTTVSVMTRESAINSGDEKIIGLWKERERLQDQFFDELIRSFRKVSEFMGRLEKDVSEHAEQLRHLTDDEVKEMGEDYIPFLYVKLQTILKYRSLNLLAFRKILKKYLERCATDSLEQQARALAVDDLIDKSNVSQSSLDLRGIALRFIAVFGTVYRLSYEEVVARLDQYENRCGATAQRLLPNSDTFFFGASLPMTERHGDFAARILAGTCSTFAEKMITEVLQCARFEGDCCGMFSNGEISVDLADTVRGDDIYIVQSLVANEESNLSNSGAVMELCLMIHTAQLAAAARITAIVPYLAYTRNVASSAALAEMIEAMGCQHLITVDMNSDQVEGMYSIPVESISAKYEFVRFLTRQLRNEGDGFTNITIVAPSGEFLGRAKDFADVMMRFAELDSTSQFISVCTAVRRVRSKQERTVTPESTGMPAFMKNTGAVPGAAAHPGRERDRLTPTFASPTSVSSGAGPFPHPQHVVGDESMMEIATATARYSEGGASSTTDPARSSSTHGMELALRQQDYGRNSIVDHHIETRSSDDDITLVGDVKGRLCIIMDTAIDEAVRICEVASALQKNGAERVLLVATHGLFTGESRRRLVESPIDLIVTTDSINQDSLMLDPLIARKLRVVPIAPLLARAIEKLHTENTLATLFEKN